MSEPITSEIHHELRQRHRRGRQRRRAGRHPECRRRCGADDPQGAGRIALAAIKGEKTLADLAQQFDVHPNQITQWRSQLLEGAAGVFGSEVKSEATAPVIDVKTLHAKIGELALENDFLSGALGKAGLLSARR